MTEAREVTPAEVISQQQQHMGLVSAIYSFVTTLGVSSHEREMLLIGNNFNMTLTAAKSLELIKINCIDY